MSVSESSLAAYISSSRVFSRDKYSSTSSNNTVVVVVGVVVVSTTVKWLIIHRFHAEPIVGTPRIFLTGLVCTRKAWSTCHFSTVRWFLKMCSLALFGICVGRSVDAGGREAGALEPGGTQGTCTPHSQPRGDITCTCTPHSYSWSYSIIVLAFCVICRLFYFILFNSVVRKACLNRADSRLMTFYIDMVNINFLWCIL